MDGIAYASLVDPDINAIFHSVQHLVTPPSELTRLGLDVRLMPASRRRLAENA